MLTEDQGVQAIIALQKMAGVDEPEDRARKNWQAFAAWEKVSTMQAHKLIFGGFPEEGKDETANSI